MSEEPTEWDDGPYEGWSIPAIIHNYVVIRGDLSEQYARDQLADLIAERIAQARREALDEAADAIAKSVPYGYGMNPDGTEDRMAMAYVDGNREAWQTVRALRGDA